MTTYALDLLQAVVLVLVAPLLQGLIKKLKAILQGRVGPPLLQPYFDLVKYFRKDEVVSIQASWLFKAVPVVVFGVLLTTTLFLPVWSPMALMSSPGDVVLLIYLFALARVLTAVAAIDTGSSFGAMGASRDMFISSLAEPVLFVTLLGVILPQKSFALATVIMQFLTGHGENLLSPAYYMLFGAFFLLLMTETGRLPVDNLDTHLELTMIHEGMLLEYSGKSLAMMTWSAQIKQVVLFTLFVDLYVPWGMTVSNGINSIALGLIVFLFKLGLVAVLVAVVEMSNAKMRLFRVPRFLFTAFMLAVAALVTESLL